MNRLDLTGKKYGHLSIIRPYPITDHYGQYWVCLCECGRELAVRGSNLTSGHTKTCGCRKWKERHSLIERKFIICPENHGWREISAVNSKMAYQKICSDYDPRKPICILDIENHTFAIYIRTLDKSGNLTKIKEIEV